LDNNVRVHPFDLSPLWDPLDLCSIEGDAMLHEEITEKIIHAFYRVYNTLGYGFLEKVYENAMAVELRKLGLRIKAQRSIQVRYGSEVVGEYFADLLVEDRIVIELKAAKMISDEHEAQLINYLKATEMEVGLLFNFGRKPEFKRKIFHNHLKKIGHGLSGSC
jgi:GxxExxY protein